MQGGHQQQRGSEQRGRVLKFKLKFKLKLLIKLKLELELDVYKHHLDIDCQHYLVSAAGASEPECRLQLLL